MFIPLILPIYYILFGKSKDKVLFYIGLLFLFFLSTFRAMSVGVDTIGYLDSYRWAQSSNLNYVWEDFFLREPIYYTIEYLCIKGGLSYRFMMVIQTLLFLTPLAIGINRIKEKPIAILAFVVLLGFFFASLNVTRQMIAVSFCFLGYVLLDEKKYVPSIIVLILAMGFHTTAALALVILALPFINLGKIWVMMVILATYALPLVLDISTYLTELTTSLALFDSFSLYLDEDFDEVGRLPIYNTIRSGMFVYAAFNYQKKDTNTDLFYKISLIAVIVHNLLYGAPSYVTRIVFYFDIAFIVFFVRWGRKNTLATYFTILYAVLYYFHQYIILKHDGVIPFEMF